MITRLILLFYSFTLVLFAGFSQAKVVKLGANSSPYYKVGSLPSNTASGSNYQKLKINVFGGNWHNRTLGDNTYYAASRDGLVINQEIRGGDHERYALKIFDDGSEFVFAIQVTSSYPLLGIESWLLESSSAFSSWQPYDIQPWVPQGTDVTNQHTVNLVYATSNDGNIGIGMNASSEKLEVNGTIRSKEVKVEASPWPDYVFEPEYDLRSLEETEQFIRANKHLPEVPSATEVEENGIALGEMNALLLKKIEELTLHVIEQEKRLEKLEAKIENK